MVHVSFTNLELYGLWQLAAARYQSHRIEFNRRVDQRTDDVLMNYIGLKGELAAAVTLQVELSLQTDATDHGVDLTGPWGTADVKTARRGGPLYVSAKTVLRAEHLVLVWPHGQLRDPYAGQHPNFWPRNAVVVGWVPTAVFLREARLHTWGYGDVRVLPASQLRPVDDMPNLAYTTTGVA